jgi:MerR family transcriptional regulator, copper efflux regulator
VERLGFITTGKRLGLPLEEIAELLHVWVDGSCTQVRDTLRPRLAARITEAEQRASELAAFTATLHRACEHLDALSDQGGRCGPQCGFLAPVPTADAQPVAVQLTMPSDRAAQVAGLAAAEQQCCPFFDFRLHLTGQQMDLEVRAPVEAATILTDLLTATG